MYFMGIRTSKGLFYLIFLALCLRNQLQVSVTLDSCSMEGKFVSAVWHRNCAQKKANSKRRVKKCIIKTLSAHSASHICISNSDKRGESWNNVLIWATSVFARQTGLIPGILVLNIRSETAFQSQWCQAPSLDLVQLALTKSSILYCKGKKRIKRECSLVIKRVYVAIITTEVGEF